MEKNDKADMHLSYARLSSEDRELKFLYLFEGFLESAPQYLIQALVDLEMKKLMKIKSYELVLRQYGCKYIEPKLYVKCVSLI